MAEHLALDDAELIEVEEEELSSGDELEPSDTPASPSAAHSKRPRPPVNGPAPPGSPQEHAEGTCHGDDSSEHGDVAVYNYRNSQSPARSPDRPRDDERDSDVQAANSDEKEMEPGDDSPEHADEDSADNAELFADDDGDDGEDADGEDRYSADVDAGEGDAEEGDDDDDRDDPDSDLVMERSDESDGDMNAVAGDDDCEEDDEGALDPSHSVRSADCAKSDDDHGNGDDDDDDDNDSNDPGQTVSRRRRRTAPLVIPDDLREDSAYFRRSSRQRYTVSRYTGDDSSDAAAENDSDFDMDEDDNEGDDDDKEGEDDVDYTRGSRRATRSARGGSQRKATSSRIEHEPMSIQDDAVERSESDDEWNGVRDKRRVFSRRRPKRSKTVAKRSSDDDDVARTVRINVRTGGAVNYAEAADSDSDIFDDEDAAANRAAKLVTSGNDGEEAESIALVCDFRVQSVEPVGDDIATMSTSTSPFELFDPKTVAFNIHWTGKSFRRNTWHSLDDLRPFKGFKKVTNYVKDVLARREELRQPSVSSEELEEAAILFTENRDALARYTHIDRIVAERDLDSGGESLEYLVKWENLPYRDCTWEPVSELQSPADVKAIDAYNDRIQASLSNAVVTGKNRRFNPFTKDARPKFKRMAKQPSYLHGEGRTLREYQLAGLNWLAFSWTNNRNVILADEMGLGKTLQTIAFLGWVMYERHVPGPFLVVVPLSTIAAWVREFVRWLPEMNVVCYSGDATSRRMIRQFEFEPVRATKSKGTGVKFHVLLTTPELAMMDIVHLEPVRWAMIAVDEAHRLKNKDSELHRSLASLVSGNRLLVTGTPLQNSVGELWALLNFLNPEQFSDPLAFEESFSFAALRDEERVAELHSTLRPFIIRRQKIDVEKSLPKKTYNVLRVGMTSSQQQLYRWLLTKNYAKLNAGTRGKGMGPKTTLRNLIMELKKCCNHPFLFENVEDTSVRTTVETLIRASGKMILLDKLLLRLREKGHRVLVFSQMVRMLDILSDYCRMRGFPFQRLDGSMPNDLRVRAVDHYNAPGSVDYVFLLSTRAGGLGINLATADTVIIFDSDWNPQNDLQAESRAHRIGQTKDVKVFRLLSRETVEEDILERAKRKRVLEHLVIHGVEGDEQDKDGKNRFNKQELKAILRFGAEKLFKEAGPSPEDGIHANGLSHGILAKDGSLSPGEDAKAEEGRVLEVDDIDELLSRAPAEPEDELGAAEANMGDSLLNAFKWADFDPIDEDEKPESEGDTGAKVAGSGDEDRQAMAKSAAKGISAKEDKRKRDIAKAKAQQEAEARELNEDDTEYWGRVIPEELKDRAVSAVIEEDMVLGTRKRKQTRTFGAETPTSKRAKRDTRGLKGSESMCGELSRKEERMVFRSWKKFWDPARARDIILDAGVGGRLEEQAVRDLLVGALSRSQLAVHEADRNQELGKLDGGGIASTDDKALVGGGEDMSETWANGKRPKSDVRLKGPPPVVIEVLGEQVNARDVIRRCAEMQLLGRLVAQTNNSQAQFRLRVHLKAPAYGIPWKPKNDAMLLLGVYRHGFGNWNRIAADSDLQLDGKMNLDATESNKGAPDPTKLTRRVNALLRELRNEEKLASAKKSKKKSSKASKAKSSKASKIGGSNGHSSSKKQRLEKMDADSPKKRARVKEKGSNPWYTDETRQTIMTDALLATQRETLRDLRRLSRQGARMSNKESIERMKICLLHLGAQIVKLAQERERVRNELWEYVHVICRTKLPGDGLGALYDKLAETERRRSEIGNGSR